MTDETFENDHYKPYTLINSPRCRAPTIPTNWIEDCRNQIGHIYSNYTYNYFPFSHASSSFQCAVRQGKTREALQWCLELMRTDMKTESRDDRFVSQMQTARKIGKGENHFWTRAFVICAEDIGLANPAILKVASQIIDREYESFHDAQIAAMNFTVALCNSLKSRLCDWAAIARFKFQNEEVFDITQYHDKLIIALNHEKHEIAIVYAEAFIAESLRIKQEISENKTKTYYAENQGSLDPKVNIVKNKMIGLDKEIFKKLAKGVKVDGIPIKYYSNVRQIMWISILKACHGLTNYPIVVDIVETCFKMSQNKRFRWKSESRLYNRMAILAICFKDKVQQRGLNVLYGEECDNINIDELYYLLDKYKQAPEYTVAEICKDKHTKEGKTLGRDIQHFIEVKSFLKYEDANWIDLNDLYIKYCCQSTWKDYFTCIGLNTFDKSGMSFQEYADWIPNLRERYSQMVETDKFYKSHTITWTCGDRAESYNNMEKIGIPLNPGDGFNPQELIEIKNNFEKKGLICEMVELNSILEGTIYTGSPACILIIRDFYSRIMSSKIETFDSMDPEKCFKSMINDIQWDTKAKMRGKVQNKRARYNIIIADKKYEQDPDYQNGKGRIMAFDSVPYLNKIRAIYPMLFGMKANKLLFEGNWYSAYKEKDGRNVGSIGWHGDAERRIVIGLRLGKRMNLQYQWYIKTSSEDKGAIPIGKLKQVHLNHGDLYIMSELAVGTDWKCYSKLCLRHAASYDDAPFESESYQPPNPMTALLEKIKQSKVKIVIMVGYPGSGKTTKAKELENETCVRIDGDVEKTSSKVMKKLNEYISNGKSVIVDACNMSLSRRTPIIQYAKERQIPIICVHFTLSLNKSFLRNKQRHVESNTGTFENPVYSYPLIPKQAYYMLRTHYVIPSYSEGFDIIKEITEEEQIKEWSLKYPNYKQLDFDK